MNRLEFRQFGVLFGLIGFDMLCVAAYELAGTMQLVAHASRTSGIVVEIVDKRSTGDRGPKYAPRVSFRTAQGQERIFTSSLSRGNRGGFSVGKHVGVLYLPNDPSKAKIDTFWQSWGFAIGFGLLDMAFIGVGV